METKQCTACHKTLPLTAFYLLKTKGRHEARCKPCSVQRVLAYRKTPHGKHVSAISTQRYRQSPKGKEMQKRNDSSAAKKAYMIAYRQTVRGKATQLRANKTPKGRARMRRYEISPKGIAAKARKAAQHRMAIHQSEHLLTVQEWEEIKRRAQNKCYYCKRTMQRLTMDHVIPISKGGLHTASNVVPACRACNSRKHNHLVLLI